MQIQGLSFVRIDYNGERFEVFFSIATCHSKKGCPLERAALLAAIRAAFAHLHGFEDDDTHSGRRVTFTAASWEEAGRQVDACLSAYHEALKPREAAAA